MIAHDANQGVCWLADANLAADSTFRASLGVAAAQHTATSNSWFRWRELSCYSGSGSPRLGGASWRSVRPQPFPDHRAASASAANAAKVTPSPSQTRPVRVH